MKTATQTFETIHLFCLRCIGRMPVICLEVIAVKPEFVATLTKLTFEHEFISAN